MTYYTREGSSSFVGEIGILSCQHERLLHKCNKNLKLRAFQSEEFVKVLESMIMEDLTCLLRILHTTNIYINNTRLNNWLEEFFKLVHVHSSSLELPLIINRILVDLTPYGIGFK